MFSYVYYSGIIINSAVCYKELSLVIFILLSVIDEIQLYEWNPTVKCRPAKYDSIHSALLKQLN